MNELRKYLETLLRDILKMPVSYRLAVNENMYPHSTFILSENYGADLNRDDRILTVDIWAKDPKTVYDAAEVLQKEFRQYKDSTEEFVITIYRNGGDHPDEDDKTLEHIIRTFDVRTYRKER